jgi:hypothetical protein
MLRSLRLTAMGLGTMPHVGPHPGLPILAALAATAVVACAPKGLLAALLAGPAMLLVLGPFVLYGAFDRARLSLDTTRADAKKLLQAYTDVHFEPGRSIRWCLMPMPHNGLWVPDHHGKRLHLFIDNHAGEPGMEPAAEYLRGLVERALSPHGLFAIPASMGMVTCIAQPLPSAHARMEAMARVSPPPALPPAPNGPT